MTLIFSLLKPRDAGTRISHRFSSEAPTAGSGLSAPRLCGRVGWPLFPLNFLSLDVVGRPSLWLVL